ncbi:MAG: hypothetical protein M1816_002792 [Peltula sp. TS41687]|nr:MAG: hypothetical protein M1816_002792 [Peltula sp. TS41687]
MASLTNGGEVLLLLPPKMGLLNTFKSKFSTKVSSPTQKSPSSSSSRRFSFRPQQSTGDDQMQDSTNPFRSTAPPTRRPDFGTQNNNVHPAGDIQPPPYTPSAAPAPVSHTGNDATDDRFGFLSTFDTIVLIDDSGSMAGRSWRETSSALAAITPVCTAHDADGIDLYFLNHRSHQHPGGHYSHVTSASTVSEIFSIVQPRGGTPTGQRLYGILKPYLAHYEAAPDTTKPLNIIVITDGVPTDDVESVIVSAAKKLDKLDAPAWQVGVQFFQVGNERGAAAALQELDDGLAEVGGLRDMVDTVPFRQMGSGGLSGEEILKVVLGAVNRRLDRKKIGGT